MNTFTSYNTVPRYASREEILLGRFRRRNEELDRKVAEDRERTQSVMTWSVAIMMVALILTMVDQTKNPGGGSAVSIISIVMFCQVCAVQAVYAFVKRQIKMGIGFAILDVVGIVTLLLVITLATGI